MSHQLIAPPKQQTTLLSGDSHVRVMPHGDKALSFPWQCPKTMNAKRSRADQSSASVRKKRSARLIQREPDRMLFHLASFLVESLADLKQEIQKRPAA